MSASEKQSAAEVDPLLKDLSEKKQTFRRSVVSLASELKEVRSQLASREQCVAREILTRQEAETKAKIMEGEISRLHRNLEEKNDQLQASTSATEMFVNEIEDLRLQFSTTKEIANASAQSAQSAHDMCSALVNEIEEKNFYLKEHKNRVTKLEEQLQFLVKDLQTSKLSHMQVKDEVSRIEHGIMQALTIFGSNLDCELQKILEETSLDRINQLFAIKDEEIANLRDDVRIVSAHCKLKTKEMESQFEKHRRVDQELKKKVLKLEFFLQDARAEIRKMQRMGEKRDETLKELRDQLDINQASAAASSGRKHNFWETAGFKIAISMSMLVLVVLTKR